MTEHTKQPDHVLWVDLETTDTNPYAEHAAVLEVGAILTRHEPELSVVAEASLLVRPPGLASDHDLMWSRMVPIVREMHTTNGLWAEATTGESAWAIHDADKALSDWLAEHTGGSEGRIPVAGSGVAHMESRWLPEWMPQLASRLTYWNLDVGQFRRWLDVAGRGDLVDLEHDVDAKPHRALADVRLHLAEGRRYVGLMGRLPQVTAAP